MIESLLLTTTPIISFHGDEVLDKATGFFFQHADKLFLVTNQHVISHDRDVPTADRIEFDVHVLGQGSPLTKRVSLDLGPGGARWRHGYDRKGEIDIAAVEIDQDVLPEDAVFECFTADNLLRPVSQVEVGESVLLVGYPNGEPTDRYHLPIVRQASLASSFGLRFDGRSYFLTDGSTQRGMSGAPVVLRDASGPRDMPWKLLGVHSSTFDLVPTPERLERGLELNCTWYADILSLLTGPELH